MSPASWFDSFVQADRLLDSMPTPSGSLAHPAVASMLCNNFDWLRKRGWRIWTACIMPSHVHCVMRNTEGRGGSLLEDLGLFKNFTGREANRLLGLQGSFWQREVFDRWCRNGEDWFRFFCYTVQNPVQAGAVQDWRNWPWTIVDPEVEALLEGGMKFPPFLTQVYKQRF